MLQVYSAENATEAHLLKGALASQGISCEVQGEDLAGTWGELSLGTVSAPTVWILDDSKYDEARTVVTEYENSRSRGSSEQEESPWNCKSCGEESQNQFTECWKCGASR